MTNILNHIFGIPIALAQVASNVGSAANQVGQETGNQFANIIGAFLAAIPLWIAAFAIAIVSYVVAIVVKKAIEAKMAAEGIEEEHKEVQIVAGRTAYFTVLVLGITISLSIVGLDLKPIVAAGAFGLGFALQDIIMNTISGVLILMSRHFTIGDIITVTGITGRIMEIQTRATIIKGFDGTRIIVPNRELFSNVVISKTSNPFRKMSFEMGVGYGSDLKAVMDLTLAIVKVIPGVLAKPRPSVIFTEWGDSSINFRINVWIESKGGKLIKVKNKVIMELSSAYEEAGFDIPYPIQTILMDKADEAEVTNAEIKEKVKAIKARLADKFIQTPAVTASAITTLTPALATANAAPVQSAEPASVPVPTPTAAPVETPPVTPATPSLPTAIDTTPNSPGQSWLQQALNQQVAQTTPATPIAPVETPAPTLTPAPAPTPVAETPVDNSRPSWLPAESATTSTTAPVASPATGAPQPAVSNPPQTPTP